MGYIVFTIVCAIIFYIAWVSVKEANAIKNETSKTLENAYRQNQFAIEQYNRNRPVQMHVKTIEELRKKLEQK